jgi:hypothetical protein
MAACCRKPTSKIAMARVVIGIVCLIASAVSSGAAWTTSPAQILAIEPGGGAVYVVMGAGANNVNGCGYFSGSQYSVSGNFFLIHFGSGTMTDTQRAIFTSLQAAQAAGKLVGIFSAGCNQGGTTGYNTIDYVWVQTN